MEATPENVELVFTRMISALGNKPGFPSDFMARNYARMICLMTRNIPVEIKRQEQVEEVFRYNDARGEPQEYKMQVEKLVTVATVNDLDHLLALIGFCQWWPPLQAVWDMYVRFAEPDPQSSDGVLDVLSVLESVTEEK